MEVVMVVAQTTPFTSIFAGRLRQRIAPFRPCCPLNFSWLLPTRSWNELTSSCSVKVSIREHFGGSSKINSGTSNPSGKLWEFLFEPVKDFPWKKAGTTLLRHATSLGLKASKWSLVIFFVISFMSDISISILSNRELIIPFGLFIGCMLAEFLKEASKELVKSEEDGDVLWRLAVLAGFFLLVRLCFQGNLFLLHLTNGALMQILWWGKKLQEVDAEEPVTQIPNTSAAADGENR